MRKNKKVLKVVTAVTSLALVSAISFGATLAYLTATTENKVNTFTSGGISISLTEPKYDLETDKTYKPGDTKAKDPTITVDVDADAYLAATLTFWVKADGATNYTQVSYNEFITNYADLNNFSDKWVEATTNNPNATNAPMVYYYSSAESLAALTKVKNGVDTPAVFDGITFSKTSAAMSPASGKTAPEVKIVVGAYGVRASDCADSAAAITNLSSLISANPTSNPNT